MPKTIDWPMHSNARPHRRNLIILAAILIGIVFCASTIISYWVDMLWFGSLGYSQVFWTSLRLEWSVFAVFALATFAVLFGAYLALRHAHGDDLPGTHTIMFG